MLLPRAAFSRISVEDKSHAADLHQGHKIAIFTFYQLGPWTRKADEPHHFDQVVYPIPLPKCFYHISANDKRKLAIRIHLNETSHRVVGIGWTATFELYVDCPKGRVIRHSKLYHPQPIAALGSILPVPCAAEYVLKINQTSSSPACSLACSAARR